MDETLNTLVQHGCFAADSAAFDLRNLGVTKSEMTRRLLTAALRMLIGNGLITVTPVEEWPEYVILDPPYRMP